MQSKIDKTIAGLKDFQNKTVEYVMKQFAAGRSRMLIADEVGLGKTIVAKGVIAKLYEKSVLNEKSKKFNVIYVCSNQAIAKANIKKLNFSEDKNTIMLSGDDDRITSLAYEIDRIKRDNPLTIRAFTPATSFDDNSSAGRKDERILLYRLLYTYAEINPHKNSLKWILKGNNRISRDTWEKDVAYAEKFGGRDIKPLVSSEFRKKMGEVVSIETLPKTYEAAGLTYSVKYWTLLKNVCQIDVRKNSTNKKVGFRYELISHLRLTLSQACLRFLNADLFILDEFQRYKKIIETDPDNTSPAIDLARAIFSLEGVKILMLSATPFKAYTTDYDEANGEVHHKEFETVLRFLNSERKPRQWSEFSKQRNELFSFLRHSKNNTIDKNKAIEIKQKLEDFYRTCMVRTERLSVSKDQDSMIKSMALDYLEPEVNDLEDFVSFDRLTKYLNDHHNTQLPVPLEYVKSSPYALSFLDGYQHRKNLMKYADVDPDLVKMLRALKHAWVNIKAIEKYAPLADSIPNAKLRLLLSETTDKGAWKLLWIPPSMPYYDFDEPFANLSDFSKVLVFSSWLLVPRMISTMVSYEAERRSVGDPRSISQTEPPIREYHGKKRHPRPQIIYRAEKEEGEDTVSQPANMLYLYPSKCLADIYDPEINLLEKKNLSVIVDFIKIKISEKLSSKQIKKYGTGNGDSRRWYWAAPLLLDKEFSDNVLYSDWFNKGAPSDDTVVDSEAENQLQVETTGKSRLFNSFRNAFCSPEEIDLPPLTPAIIEKVANDLTILSLGSPSICFLRTLLRNYGNATSVMLDSSYEVASSFVTLFNKPESISAIRLCTVEIERESYLDRVMSYSIAGNIQAMLDEYFHLIREIEGLYSIDEISTHISDTLSIRSSTMKVDDFASFNKVDQNSTPGSETRKRSIRTHFAINFAGKELKTAKTSGRQVTIRQAFNSPFRPFVLATTSIGQEGLDFHLYCRKIFHWNLPSNAIDIEQREGRINRYKGLVIRQNLVKKYSDTFFKDGKKDAWDQLFHYAELEEGKGKGMCEMIPFWHTEPVENLKIERFVPLYAFSKDIDKYKELLKILAYYRITFGQPRQEELIAAISDLEENDISDLMSLLIDLSPIRFYNA